MSKSNLTAERLRELLHYNPETGVFTRIKNRRSDLVGTVAGSINRWNNGRVIICVDMVEYKAHRLAWLYMTGKWPVNVIDHIDCNPSNNALENLRDVTIQINCQNQRKAANNRSGFLGVSRNWYAGRWMAKIKVDRVEHYLGIFDTPEEAHAAYVAAKRRLHPGGML